MTEHIRHIKEIDRNDTTLQSPDTIVERDSSSPSQVHQQNVVVNIVWYIAGILLAILALRFILALLGANPANAFANFIYTISYPFVAPFFSLFSYNLRYGVSRFETFTLVAMVIYALIAYGITQLLLINRPVRRTY